MDTGQSSRDKEIKSFWISEQRKVNANGEYSEVESEQPDSNSDLFDLNLADGCYFNDVSRNGSRELVKYGKTIGEKLQKLTVVQLDRVSISSAAATFSEYPSVNINQSFTFPTFSRRQSDVTTQTAQFIFPKTGLLVTGVDEEAHIHRKINRPLSLPPEIISFTNLGKRVQSDVEPQNAAIMIGDGDKIINEGRCLKKPDQEIEGCIASTALTLVQSVLIRPKSRLTTPKCSIKKRYRPPTKYVKKQTIEGDEEKNSTSTSSCGDNKLTAKNLKSKILKNADVALDVGGNYQTRLSGVVDKLQDHDWEVCIEGLKSFLLLAGGVNWDSELGQKYMPVINRKLIDFFKSPRSNLCRTACQTAGEFFLIAKCTKRPEFDEMVDILLNKSADPNRFIQKDAIVALDKMAISVCVQHSVRAVCAKAPDHKNCSVRAATARVLYQICKHSGEEQIIGASANPRTRKCVLAILAKFLLDKNQDTRRYAEKLCKMLKGHKFFAEYFFKDIANNFRNPLRKIINGVDDK